MLKKPVQGQSTESGELQVHPYGSYFKAKALSTIANRPQPSCASQLPGEHQNTFSGFPLKIVSEDSYISIVLFSQGCC